MQVSKSFRTSGGMVRKRNSSRFVQNAAIAVVASLPAIAGAVPNYTLQHTNSIDLSTQFNGLTNYGTNPLSIAFDGTNAYVGGYVNGGSSWPAWMLQVAEICS